MTDEEPLCIAIEDLASPPPEAPVILRRSSDQTIDPRYILRPKRIEIPGSGGPVFGMLYPPENPHAQGPLSAKPPLIINLHGGPTSAAARGMKARTLFFTSRGFSWLDLDYSGSTGYGRHYRDRLKGNWGITDVADTIAAAKFAQSSGLADAGAIFVTGGSAGGYTALMAIAMSDIFRGAASYYGICDLVRLQQTTHKFEIHYLAGLLGAPLEENEALYRSRSALTHADRIKTPLILFQGADDPVVPKEQSRAIASALRERGLPVEYHEFEGEEHGFRKAETISRSLELELDFYQRLLS
jgi:dipeptidyl aminopeptidase/acylaminoacyl peptidase